MKTKFTISCDILPLGNDGAGRQWWRTPYEFSLNLIDWLAPADYHGTAGSVWVCNMCEGATSPPPFLEERQLLARPGSAGRAVHRHFKWKQSKIALDLTNRIQKNCVDFLTCVNRDPCLHIRRQCEKWRNFGCGVIGSVATTARAARAMARK